ncbi:probable 39S ribosomal protein L24, mitochondrial [Osmia bicornis bicornis]|uniref:probable 39S ribosomal protein L24, mitochondrial n=1 Tax=Osmia bicornis bicornis TaxID=1437191 RepID=UPI0010F77C7C|nr:probable 39S ribosomal protein L24, mitochondrial [Osmia bicornis bicornis]
MRLTGTLLSKIGEWSKKYGNLPDRYIDRVMEKVYWKSPPGKPQYLRRKIVATKKFYFSIHRPWTTTFQVENFKHKRRDFVPVEPIKDWSFFRGDRVEVLVGKDRGKQGIVRDIIQERNWIIVQGLNTKLIIQGKTKDFPGICMLIEQPLLVTTQVQLVDPYDLKGAPIEWRYTEEGEKVRISTRSNRIIPIPVSSKETIDYKSPELYMERPKDTVADHVKEVTFEAHLKTFEMDIMDKMGIKEDRVPKKYFWY